MENVASDRPPLLGAHESVAGGLDKAFARIRKVGGESLQIFTRNQRQWQAAPVSDQEQEAFARAWRESGDMPVAAHASYLINLASGKREQAARSVRALADELIRCRRLGIDCLVIHPGSHGGDGVGIGIRRVAVALDQALETAGDDGAGVRILLETTAGQGSGLGAEFAELGAMIGLSAYPHRLGICVDTCHVFAAGYDLRTPEGYRDTMEELEQAVGLERVGWFHLNDSKTGLGSRVDRHEHIGRGAIGLEGFRLLLNDPRLAGQAMTLETPKGKDLAEDRRNLRVLRGLLDQAPGDAFPFRNREQEKGRE